MGLRFRRSWSVLPGIRFNLGLKSGSVSFGVRGLHYTVGTRGSQVTAGIPGTGLFWTKRINSPFGQAQAPHPPAGRGARPPQLPLPQAHSPRLGGGIQKLRQLLGGAAQSPQLRQPQTYSPPNRGGAPPQQVRQPQTYSPPTGGAMPFARANPTHTHIQVIGSGNQSSSGVHRRVFVPLWLVWTALAVIVIAGLCIMAGIFGALVR
jgi:Protein of unknown function (DUF4236)